MIDCPFSACTWSGVPLVLQAMPGDDELTSQHVPQHDLTPNQQYGMCPASLMTLPLSIEARRTLAEAEDSAVRFRISLDVISRPAPLGAPPHSKAPDPSRGSDRWFRAGATGDNPRGEHGPLGYQRSPLGYTPGRDEGGSMASVADVKAALQNAQRLAAEAQELTQGALFKFMEAHAVASWVRQTSVDPIGTAALTAAMERLQEAMTLAAQAIDEQGTYGASL